MNAPTYTHTHTHGTFSQFVYYMLNEGTVRKCDVITFHAIMRIEKNVRKSILSVSISL